MRRRTSRSSPASPIRSPPAAPRNTNPHDETVSTKPGTVQGAHERRYLHMSPLPSGEWVGRFGCGPEQGLRLKRALAAWSAPRPGTAIDADGVQHEIPDIRDLGARQM